MSIFASVVLPPSAQQSILVRNQQRQRKRKRINSGSDDDDASEEDGDGSMVAAILSVNASTDPDARLKKVTTTNMTTATAAASSQPVSRTDPYHVAGHSREVPLPPHPFPHSSVTPTTALKTSTGEELAGLNPPLYMLQGRLSETSAYLKRGHLDVLTTLLHSCMLKGDWQRASRAWALLLRTEIRGRGIDVRRHERWAIPAELLMRSHEEQCQPQSQHRASAESNEKVEPFPRQSSDELTISNQGFRLARGYYERLILQYPHTNSQQGWVTSLAVYPALFNVWIYEVQDRSRRARQKFDRDRPTSSDSHSSDAGADLELRSERLMIRRRELEEASPILQRIDELLLSPPYDTSLPLLQLKGMVGLWISDICADLADGASDYEDGTAEPEVRAARLQERADIERRQALKLLRKLTSIGKDSPQQIADMLSSSNDDISE